MDEFEKTIRKQVEENCSNTCFYTLWPMKTYRLLHALSEAKDKFNSQENKYNTLLNALNEAYGKRDSKLDNFYYREVFNYYNEFQKQISEISKAFDAANIEGYPISKNGLKFMVKDMPVYLDQMKVNSGLASYDYQKNEMLIHCFLKEGFLFKKDLDFLKSDIFRSIFVHEMTHKFDTQAKKATGKSIEKIKNYNNNEYEYNAFLMSLIDRITSYLKKKGITPEINYNQDIQKQINNHIEEILNEIKTVNPNGEEDILVFSEFYNGLNKDYRNRLVHDLYDYFTSKIYWQDQLHSIP